MMKRLCFIVLIFVLVGCSSGKLGEEQIEKEINTKTGTVQNTELPEKTKIHVAVIDEDSHFTAVCREFMKENQDVEIVIDRIEDTEKYFAQTVTKSMSGDTTSDLTVATPLTNTLALYDSGMYVDFYELMKNDADFNEDDYYMNCYEAFEYRGKLYELPLDVNFWLVGANTLLPKEILSEFNSMSTISYDKMTDLYKRSVDEAKKLKNSDLQQTFYVEERYDLRMHFSNNINNFIDFDNKTCDFSNSTFYNLLKTGKTLTEPMRGTRATKVPLFSSPKEDAEPASKYLFNTLFSNHLQVFFEIDEYKYFTDYKPLADNNGNVFVFSNLKFNLMETSKNKEICWELMKYFNNPKIFDIEPEEGKYGGLSIDYSFFKINKELNQAKVKSSTKTHIDWLRRDYGLVSEMSTDSLVNKTEKIYKDVYESKLVNQYKGIEFMQQEALYKYYSGFITAEQAAAELQNYATLLFME